MYKSCKFYAKYFMNSDVSRSLRYYIEKKDYNSSCFASYLKTQYVRYYFHFKFFAPWIYDPISWQISI